MATAEAPLVDTWPSFASFMLRRYERFVREQTDTWNEVCRLRDSVIESPESPGALASARTLADAAVQFERVGRRLLLTPYERCGHLRPISRSLNAMEDLDREVSSHAAALEYVEGTRMAPLLRARLDGTVQLLLCRACLRLGQSWNAYLAGEAGLQEKFGRTARRASSGVSPAAVQIERTQASQTLERYPRWIEDALIYAALHRNRRRLRESLVKKHKHHLEFWRGRQRDVAGILELDTGIWRTALSTIRETDAAIGELKKESNDLRRQLRVLTEYLERWTAEPFNPPAADARILGPEERIELWQSHVTRIVSQSLPKEIAVPRPLLELPSVLERDRRTYPRRMYLRALRYEVLPVVEERFRARILFHLDMAAALVRAAEVVRYALEVSGESADGLVAEALRNAIGLLKTCDESPKWDWKNRRRRSRRRLSSVPLWFIP